MEQDNEEIIRKAFNTFITEELLNPTINKYLESYFDPENFHRLSEPLAELLEEYYPEYFAENYKSHIGKYFYVAFYGDALTEEELFNRLNDYKEDETDKNIEGLNLRFTDSLSSLKYHFEVESLREGRFHVHDTSEVIELVILNLLNQGKITI